MADAGERLPRAEWVSTLILEWLVKRYNHPVQGLVPALIQVGWREELEVCLALQQPEPISCSAGRILHCQGGGACRAREKCHRLPLRPPAA